MRTNISEVLNSSRSQKSYPLYFQRFRTALILKAMDLSHGLKNSNEVLDLTEIYDCNLWQSTSLQLHTLHMAGRRAHV